MQACFTTRRTGKLFRGLFNRDPAKDCARRAYETIVARSREPSFYTDFGVADTLDGRFDLLVAHMALVQIRLRAIAGSAAFAQLLFDVMFVDMDQSLREMGVSDMVVGSRVKQMGKAFYGRLAAYAEGLSTTPEGSEDRLAAAVLRNLYRGADDRREAAAAFAVYMRTEADHLARLGDADMTSGRFVFGALSGVPRETAR